MKGYHMKDYDHGSWFLRELAYDLGFWTPAQWALGIAAAVGSFFAIRIVCRVALAIWQVM